MAKKFGTERSANQIQAPSSTSNVIFINLKNSAIEPPYIVPIRRRRSQEGPRRRLPVHPRGSPGGAETTRAEDTALAEAEALKLQACLKAQIWLEDGHVSSGLRGFA